MERFASEVKKGPHPLKEVELQRPHMEWPRMYEEVRSNQVESARLFGAVVFLGTLRAAAALDRSGRLEAITTEVHAKAQTLAMQLQEAGVTLSAEDAASPPKLKKAVHELQEKTENLAAAGQLQGDDLTAHRERNMSLEAVMAELSAIAVKYESAVRVVADAGGRERVRRDVAAAPEEAAALGMGNVAGMGDEELMRRVMGEEESHFFRNMMIGVVLTGTVIYAVKKGKEMTSEGGTANTVLGYLDIPREKMMEIGKGLMGIVGGWLESVNFPGASWLASFAG
jgi:hypothetical protein